MPWKQLNYIHENINFTKTAVLWGWISLVYKFYRYLCMKLQMHTYVSTHMLHCMFDMSFSLVRLFMPFNIQYFIYA